MPISIPAYCSECKKWSPSVMQIEGELEEISFSGIGTNCGFCNGDAVIIDGTYNTIGETLKIVESHDLSKNELKKLTQILQQAIKQNTPAGEIRNIIEREIPKASGLNKFIRDGLNLPFLLALAVAILAWQFPATPPSPDKPAKSREEIIYDELNKINVRTENANQVRKVGVNAACACGSGRKSKKCCGIKHKLVARPQNTNQKPK